MYKIKYRTACHLLQIIVLCFTFQYELLYYTVGRYRFQQITANLDVFLRRFNEIQYWVITEILLVTSLNKRVQILRKMIKLAA